MGSGLIFVVSRKIVLFALFSGSETSKIRPRLGSVEYFLRYHLSAKTHTFAENWSSNIWYRILAMMIYYRLLKGSIPFNVVQKETF